jgi:hypothetical protein
MISGLEMFDNDWLVILLNGPNIFHLNQIRPTVVTKQKTPEI